MITAAILICLAPVAYDGDTLRCGNSPARVRLFGIEAPEIGITGAIRARNASQAEATGGLICEPRGTNYTRVVAICRNAAGVDIGKALLDKGLVKEWCAYSRNYYGTCAVANRRP